MSNNEHRTLTSEREIAAYLHRTRIAILDALSSGPATASQIGDKLGVHPANLTRHIRTLVDAGLIELVEKRDTGRNLEKYYAAIAATFDVAPEAHDLKAPHKIALAFARSDLSAALAHVSDDDSRPVAVLVAGVRIRDSDVERFKRVMEELIESFIAADQEKGETYHLNLCLYPSNVDLPRQERIALHRTKE